MCRARGIRASARGLEGRMGEWAKRRKGERAKGRTPNAERQTPNAKRPTRVHPAKLVIYPLFPAPVLNRWLRRSRRLSVLAMRPPEAQAISGGGPARDLDRQTRPSRTNWLHVIMAAAGITLVSSVAGVLAYNWYFDTTLVALSSSLQPISSAFHQLGGSHLRQPSSPTPGN